MTYWFAKSETFLCNPSLTQTDEFISWCNKVKFFKRHNPRFSFIYKFSFRSQDTQEECQMDVHRGLMANQVVGSLHRALRDVTLWSPGDTHSAQIHTLTNTITRHKLTQLHWQSPCIAALTQEHAPIHTPAYSGFHPHVSTHTSAQASFLTLFHKAVGWTSINRV